MLCIVAATERELAGAATAAQVETLTCGVGPVAAAIAVSDRLAREPRPSALLHVGIAGARRDSGITPCSVVVGTEARYCDTTSQLVQQLAEPDPQLLAAARAALDAPVLTTIGTSADVGGTSGCDVEAMEGFAVLAAAARAGVPAVEVRVVSNEIEESDRSRWHFEPALDHLARLLPQLVEGILR